MQPEQPEDQRAKASRRVSDKKTRRINHAEEFFHNPRQKQSDKRANNQFNRDLCRFMFDVEENWWFRPVKFTDLTDSAQAHVTRSILLMSPQSWWENSRPETKDENIRVLPDGTKVYRVFPNKPKNFAETRRLFAHTVEGDFANYIFVDTGGVRPISPFDATEAICCVLQSWTFNDIDFDASLFSLEDFLSPIYDLTLQQNNTSSSDTRRQKPDLGYAHFLSSLPNWQAAIQHVQNGYCSPVIKYVGEVDGRDQYECLENNEVYDGEFGVNVDRLLRDFKLPYSNPTVRAYMTSVLGQKSRDIPTANHETEGDWYIENGFFLPKRGSRVTSFLIGDPKLINAFSSLNRDCGNMATPSYGRIVQQIVSDNYSNSKMEAAALALQRKHRDWLIGVARQCGVTVPDGDMRSVNAGAAADPNVSDYLNGLMTLKELKATALSKAREQFKQINRPFDSVDEKAAYEAIRKKIARARKKGGR